jgi:hypothetical protein
MRGGSRTSRLPKTKRFTTAKEKQRIIESGPLAFLPPPTLSSAVSQRVLV